MPKHDCLCIQFFPPLTLAKMHAFFSPSTMALIPLTSWTSMVLTLPASSSYSRQNACIFAIHASSHLPIYSTTGSSRAGSALGRTVNPGAEIIYRIIFLLLDCITCSPRVRIHSRACFIQGVSRWLTRLWTLTSSCAGNATTETPTRSKVCCHSFNKHDRFCLFITICRLVQHTFTHYSYAHVTSYTFTLPYRNWRIWLSPQTAPSATSHIHWRTCNSNTLTTVFLLAISTLSLHH